MLFFGGSTQQHYRTIFLCVPHVFGSLTQQHYGTIYVCAPWE